MLLANRSLEEIEILWSLAFLNLEEKLPFRMQRSDALADQCITVTHAHEDMHWSVTIWIYRGGYVVSSECEASRGSVSLALTSPDVCLSLHHPSILRSLGVGVPDVVSYGVSRFPFAPCFAECPPCSRSIEFRFTMLVCGSVHEYVDRFFR